MQAHNGGAASALHWPPGPRMRTLVPPLHEQYSILAHAANQRVRREQTVSSWTLKWHHHQQSYEGCMEPDLNSDWRWRSGRRCPSKGPRLGARLCGAWRVPRKPRHPPGSSNGCRPPPRWSDEWKAGERGGGAGEERPPPSPPFHSPVCMPAAPALSVTLTSFFLGPAVTWRRARRVLTSFCHPRVPPRPTPWAFKKGRLDLLCRCRPVSQPLPILRRRCLFRTIATRPLSPPPPPFGSHPLTPRRHSRWPSPP